MQTAMTKQLCAAFVFATTLPSAALTVSNARLRQTSAVATPGATYVDDDSTMGHISKVLALLQSMATSLEGDAGREKVMFSNYMGYCNVSKTRLQGGISAGNTQFPQLQSNLEDAEAAVATLRVQLGDKREDRAQLSKDVEDAKISRGNERAKHIEESTSLTSYVDALRKTTEEAQRGGTRRAFLQQASPAATALVRKAATEDQEITDDDRQSVLAFLSGEDLPQDQYIPSSGEVVSILNALLEDYSKDAASENEAEQDAQASFDAWSTSKAQSLKALNADIAGKMSRVGELEVQTAGIRREMVATEAAVSEDSKYLLSLQENCENRAAEYSQRVELRGQELAAIQGAVQALSGSDTTQLFTRALPSSGSFVQTGSAAPAAGREGQSQESGEERRRLAALALLARVPPSQGHARPEVLFLEVALQRNHDGEKLAKMIDEIVALQSQQQLYDDRKQDYCEANFRCNAGANSTIEDPSDCVDDLDRGIKQVEMDMQMFQENVAVLDKLVTEATEQRSEESSQYSRTESDRNKTIAVLQYARKCIDDFYNPQPQDQPVFEPATPAAQGQDAGSTFLQTGESRRQQQQQQQQQQLRRQQEQHLQHQQNQRRRAVLAAKLDPVPEVWGAYHRKVEESSAVVSTLDFLLRGMRQEKDVGDQGEGSATRRYEAFMEASARDRAQYMKTLSAKQRARSNAVAAKTAAQGEITAELASRHAIRSSLEEVQSDCVEFLQNAGALEEARGQEVANLQAAKAALTSASHP